MAETTNANQMDRELLRTMLVGQHERSMSWLKFLITIQAALAAALWTTMVFASRKENAATWFQKYCSLLVPVMGIITCITLTLIVVRERKWQNWYIDKSNQPHIWKMHNYADVSKVHLGYVSKTVIGLCITVTLAWLVAIVTRFM